MPKMKENPRMIVARGTREVNVSDLLKMRRQMKMMMMSAKEMSTASSFATAEPTSWWREWEVCRRRGSIQTHLEARCKSLAFAIDTRDGLAHLLLGDVAIAVLVKELESLGLYYQ